MICEVGTDKLTKALRGWLESSHDDGERKLIVEERGAGLVCVRRKDGSDLSEAEEREIRAILAANRVKPLRSIKR